MCSKRCKIIWLSIFLSVLLLVNRNLFSQKHTGYRSEITIVDINSDYPILNMINNSGFFKKNNFLVSKIAYKKQTVPNIKNINIYSNLKGINGIEYSEFTILSKNVFKQNIRVKWEIPRDEDYDSFRINTLGGLLKFVHKTKESDVNEVVTASHILSDSDIFFRVSYIENDSGTQISGYDFTVVSRPTATHRFWRTFGELFLLNSIGVANYWIFKDQNMEDWEYRADSEGLKKKMADGWALDSNAFRTNTLYHIYGGAIYYQTAMSNGYGYVASTLWTFVGSLMWEYIGEYREQVSTNDMIFTTMGGVMLGEAFRQSSHFLERRMGKGILRDILVTLLDPMRLINSKIDRSMSNTVRINLVFINPAQVLIEQTANDKIW